VSEQRKLSDSDDEAGPSIQSLHFRKIARGQGRGRGAEEQGGSGRIEECRRQEKDRI
jgi:hypothetical protein